ncbi:MAG: ferrochelatase [Alphaproteobacteria bacterium]|nr:ferrochelatase [Alphaproteobacteria bacterium]
MKTAVVLLNLGGPDSLDAVQPFLQNLFSDPAIISAPAPIRWLLARLISRRRAPVARKIYAEIGGRSPLLPNTEAQASALANALGEDAKVFIAMRYWHPFVEETARAVKAWMPERVVLLPLYPQFSTTTTQSSFDAWDGAATAIGLKVPTARLCCYPDDGGFVAANARLLAKTLDLAGGPVRVLFSAHGLPKRVVERGDPYPSQVERSAKAIMVALGRSVDWVVCYQSRVGPLEWIGPSTEAEIRRAAADKLMPGIVPLSFVSEHSETLVELDREYRDLAEAAGAPGFLRVPTVSTDALFIDGLARLVRAAPAGLSSGCGRRICPAEHRRCPNQGLGNDPHASTSSA